MNVKTFNVRSVLCLGLDHHPVGFRALTKPFSTSETPLTTAQILDRLDAQLAELAAQCESYNSARIAALPGRERAAAAIERDIARAYPGECLRPDTFRASEPILRFPELFGRARLAAAIDFDLRARGFVS